MAAFLAMLSAGWATVWSILSPFKAYILTAILAIVVWQNYAPRTWVEPAKPWAVSAQVQTVESGTSFVVKARAGVFVRTRNVQLAGITVPESNVEAAKTFLTQALNTDDIILSVVSGNHIGAGDMTAVAYTREGVCVQLAMICDGLAKCSNNEYPEWLAAESAYNAKSADTPVLVMPNTPTLVGDMVKINLQGFPATALPKLQVWVAPDEATEVIVGRGLQTADPAFVVFRAKQPGAYKFIAVAPDGSGNLLAASDTLTVTGTVPPKPPIPPDPKPPTPDPPTPPTPVKLRVLALYDPATVDKLSEQQRQIIYSEQPGSMRDYIKSHALTETVKDAAGKTTEQPAMRIWPTNVNAAQAGTNWKPLLDKTNKQPCLVVQAGDTITKFDFPATNADAVKLLKQFGGE